MQKNKALQFLDYRPLIVGLILSFITGILVVIAGKDEVISEIDRVLILISGMTTGAALSAFNFYRGNGITENLVNENYNDKDVFLDEQIVSNAISSLVLMDIPELELFGEQEKEKVTNINTSSWNLNLSQLLSEDNSLALAKLRIEIEQEIRRLAYLNNIDIDAHPLGVTNLAQELVSQGILSTIWLEALKDTIFICDRAIHGLKISDEQAASIVRVATRLIEQLRLISAQDIKKQIAQR